MNIVSNQQLFHEKSTLKQIKFQPLENEMHSVIPTAQAAYYLNRKSQTLRAWACFDNGPIRPIRINGRLAWSVPAIRNLLAGGR